jgi:hypothetical protein
MNEVQNTNNCADGNARLTQTFEDKESCLMNVPHICIIAHLCKWNVTYNYLPPGYGPTAVGVQTCIHHIVAKGVGGYHWK